MRSSRTVAAILTTPLITVLAACGTATAPGPELALSRMRWAQRGPASYSITVTRSCECLEESTGPVVVTVRDGVVESRHYTRNGAAVPAVYADLFPSVDGLFAIVEAAQREAAHLDVTYDATFGYPARIAIDWHATQVDDEVTYMARDLLAR